MHTRLGWNKYADVTPHMSWEEGECEPWKGCWDVSRPASATSQSQKRQQQPRRVTTGILIFPYIFPIAACYLFRSDWAWVCTVLCLIVWFHCRCVFLWVSNWLNLSVFFKCEEFVCTGHVHSWGLRPFLPPHMWATRASACRRSRRDWNNLQSWWARRFTEGALEGRGAEVGTLKAKTKLEGNNRSGSLRSSTTTKMPWERSASLYCLLPMNQARDPAQDILVKSIDRCYMILSTLDVIR